MISRKYCMRLVAMMIHWITINSFRLRFVSTAEKIYWSSPLSGKSRTHLSIITTTKCEVHVSVYFGARHAKCNSDSGRSLVATLSLSFVYTRICRYTAWFVIVQTYNTINTRSIAAAAAAAGWTVHATHAIQYSMVCCRDHTSYCLCAPFACHFEK